MNAYQALFQPDKEAGGYVVTFPDFGYGVTQGETLAEAMELAQELLLLTIDDHIREGKTVPASRHRRGRNYRSISLPTLAATKVDLYSAFLASGLSKSEFARRTGIPKTHVVRLFSLSHRSRLEQIEAALAALGKRLHVEVRDAA